MRPDEAETNFRTNMRSLRMTRMLTQMDIQEATGIDRTVIAKMECGNQGLPLGRAVSISEALGVSLDVLIHPVDIHVDVQVAAS